MANIPDSVLDAARVDGAGVARTIWHLHLPLLASQIKLLLILTIVTVVLEYEAVYVLTGDGGPGYATIVPGLHMYASGFSYGRMGYASVIGLVMFLALLAVTVLNMRYFRSATEYAPE